jgi:hypothetical protein
LFATVAQAAVIVAPLESGTSIAKVAQDCGPGGWRGPAPTDAANTVMPGTAGAAPMAACTAGNNLPSCASARALAEDDGLHRWPRSPDWWGHTLLPTRLQAVCRAPTQFLLLLSSLTAMALEEASISPKPG